MGSYLSRQLNNAGVEEDTDSANNLKYKYPPKTGNYFSTTFIMGGEKFNTPSPENYLFGENTDLNFLTAKPTSFPYSPPNSSEPTKTLKSLVNIRKESVKFVKITEPVTKADGTTTSKGTSFNIEFVFDSDTKCAITIYYFCTEEVNASGVSYVPRDPSLTSETYHYPKGANQIFFQPSHIFNPSMFSDEDLSYNSEKDVYPVVIHCVADEGLENIECRHSHSTVCVVDHHTTDGSYALRALKQKIFVDGLCYLLQEIYGIENKNLTRPITDDDLDDNGSECVICMCDTRDTLILPCRHLCLCNSCADSLRYQANNCPICRAPFRALLQIRAVQRTGTGLLNISSSNCQDSTDGIPAGYLPVSLIEALNGPVLKANRSNSEKKDSITTVEMLNKDLNDVGAKISPVGSMKRGSKEKLNQNGNTESFRLTNLKGGEETDLLSPTSASTTFSNREKKEKSLSRTSSNKDRECVKYLNEKTSNNQYLDDDSEAEKLSPLLVSNKLELKDKLPQILHKEADTDTEGDFDDVKEKSKGKLDTDKDRDPSKADDSDYYTPEDPHTTILSPFFSEKTESTNFTAKKSEIVTPISALKDADIPDSPISGNSQVSTRSSGDSYSSSSSTRQLLAVPPDTQSDGQLKQVSDNKIDDGNKLTDKTSPSQS